jgi:hypothetical protein
MQPQEDLNLLRRLQGEPTPVIFDYPELVGTLRLEDVTPSPAFEPEEPPDGGLHIGRTFVLITATIAATVFTLFALGY